MYYCNDNNNDNVISVSSEQMREYWGGSESIHNTGPGSGMKIQDPGSGMRIQDLPSVKQLSTVWGRDKKNK